MLRGGMDDNTSKCCLCQIMGCCDGLNASVHSLAFFCVRLLIRWGADGCPGESRVWQPEIPETSGGLCVCTHVHLEFEIHRARGWRVTSRRSLTHHVSENTVLHVLRRCCMVCVSCAGVLMIFNETTFGRGMLGGFPCGWVTSLLR